jgi:hypothetical protein
MASAVRRTICDTESEQYQDHAAAHQLADDDLAIAETRQQERVEFALFALASDGAAQENGGKYHDCSELDETHHPEQIFAHACLLVDGIGGTMPGTIYREPDNA